MSLRIVRWLLAAFLIFGCDAWVTGQQAHPRPHVVVVGVNGMEWDFIRPLLLKGELPNLAHIIERGVYGKLRTISAPNCPKVHTARRKRHHRLHGRWSYREHCHAETAAAVVPSLRTGRDGWFGQCARHLPG